MSHQKAGRNLHPGEALDPRNPFRGVTGSAACPPAVTPDGKVKRKNGKDATVDINDKNNADALSLYITQVAAQS
jgi:hypothetical protein